MANGFTPFSGYVIVEVARGEPLYTGRPVDSYGPGASIETLQKRARAHATMSPKSEFALCKVIYRARKAKPVPPPPDVEVFEAK